MESSNSDTPVFTLKVDFGCSMECPRDVKNMLQQLKGVKSISIDSNQGKVIVVGHVSPVMLIKLLQKMGRKAQLWSFDKPTMHNTGGFSPKQRQKSRNSHCCCESSDSGEDSDTDIYNGHLSCKHKDHRAQRHDKKSKKRCSCKHNLRFADEYAAPPSFTGYQPQLMQGYQPYAGYQQPMLGYQPYMGYHLPLQYQSVAYARPVPSHGYYRQVHPVPSSYWHPRYGSRFLAKQNPMFHYTSYADNYHYPV
ncbi:hypothetical protein HN51_028020 [Arachis hypogaea]|uniref:HMA domain-containing protein n=2 Tax=Arachis TaxID=3817 RepID=A0A445BKQ9_ARAHY|nr:heavy metal-associated isoprenylated plant protein 28-like [Arachis duranensis]QHO34476.1 Heavy-metal-associated domain protein [Arachis hypogaea]RYR39181.1 hypothetical protein Ahy_A09g044654 [Arachis hypogaea]